MSTSPLDQVAHALMAISHPLPNRHSDWRVGDLEGDWHAWFDGGAVRWISGGSTHYGLSDGTELKVSALFSRWSVRITFAAGGCFELEECETWVPQDPSVSVTQVDESES